MPAARPPKRSRSKRPRHNIDVRSRVGASSAFTVEVPLGRAEVADVSEQGQNEEQGCTYDMSGPTKVSLGGHGRAGSDAAEPVQAYR